MNDSPFSCLPDLPCDIAPYVPHRYGMCLLDTLLAVGEEHLHASVTPQRDDLFATHDGIPGWVGLEWLSGRGGWRQTENRLFARHSSLSMPGTVFQFRPADTY